jgi:SAM-dependent methyltransferase
LKDSESTRVREPVHDTEASGQLFRQWQLYRKVIACDYMCHRVIHAALRQCVERRMKEPFRLLDLGCGDASGIRETFRGTQLRDYIGVDLSDQALMHARTFLAEAPFTVELVAEDFFRYLERTTAGSLDAVLIGHSLHHLHSGEKRELLRQGQRVLRPGGLLLVYDLFRLPGQDRQLWLVEVRDLVRREWTEFTAEEVAMLQQHVTECDFPEATDDFLAMARDAGFQTGVAPLFQSPNGYFACYGLER